MNRRAVATEVERKGKGLIPTICNWYAKETEMKYGADLEKIRQEYPDDIVLTDFLAGTEGYDDHPYWYGGLDEFGCRWDILPDGVSANVREHPLTDWDDLDAYLENQLPSVQKDTRDRFELARTMRTQNPDSYVVGKSFRVFFERMHFLRGMTNLFVDLYENRDYVNRLAEGLLRFNLQLIDGWRDVGVDAVFISDDWGTQDNLLINPQLWREMFKPWYASLFDAIKERNMHVWFHSCGNVYQIIEDLIECGVEVLHPLQPEAMDLGRVSREFRGRITFCGAISVQDTLPYGTPQAVRDEAERCVQFFNTERGGYIAAPSNTIMPETPLENIMTFCRTFKRLNQSLA